MPRIQVCSELCKPPQSVLILKFCIFHQGNQANNLRSPQDDAVVLGIISNNGQDQGIWHPNHYRTKGRCCINKAEIKAYVKSMINKVILSRFKDIKANADSS